MNSRRSVSDEDVPHLTVPIGVGTRWNLVSDLAQRSAAGGRTHRRKRGRLHDHTRTNGPLKTQKIHRDIPMPVTGDGQRNRRPAGQATPAPVPSTVLVVAEVVRVHEPHVRGVPSECDDRHSAPPLMSQIVDHVLKPHLKASELLQLADTELRGSW